MSRITHFEEGFFEYKPGANIVVEYDVPPDAWYFSANGSRIMPLCVLMEIGLQPCGWLVSAAGAALRSEESLSFRNLDGRAEFFGDVLDDAGILKSKVTLKSLSQASGMILCTFRIETSMGDKKIFDMDSGFGFFPRQALDQQAGLPTTNEQRAILEEPSSFVVDLEQCPSRYCGGELCLAEPMLLMLDRITAYWPQGGKAGLGRLRAEKTVDPAHWYFKAHFFQDPVQPGSLGIEAMLQLLQFYLIERDLHEGVPHPRFEAIALEIPLTWKYRGQVLPSNELVVITMDIDEAGVDERGPYAVATASLWVDGMRIYEANGLGMRVVPSEPSTRARRARTVTLDPQVDRWVCDHRPTWTTPTLAFMNVVDLMAEVVVGNVVEMRDILILDWIEVNEPIRLRAEVVRIMAGRRPGLVSHDVRLLRLTGDQTTEVAKARVQTGPYPLAPSALPRLDAPSAPSVYESAEIFHGPAFQLLTHLCRDPQGASEILDLERSGVPNGRLKPALLEATIHGIPHSRIHLWTDEIGDDQFFFPVRVPRLRIFGPTPDTDTARAEVRFEGLLAQSKLPQFFVQIITDQGVWAEFTLIEQTFPTSRALQGTTGQQRRSFIENREYIPGIRISHLEKGETRLSARELAQLDWMPGTIPGIFGTRDIETIAIKEHLAGEEKLHPSILPEALPLTRHHLQVDRREDGVLVRTLAPPELDVKAIIRYWQESKLGFEGSMRGDIVRGLLQRYVRRVVLADPTRFESLKGRSALFLANHQVQVEDLTTLYWIGALTGAEVTSLADVRHLQGWLRPVHELTDTCPSGSPLNPVLFFDQTNPKQLFEILDTVEGQMKRSERSFLVHPQGRLSLSCRERVNRLSSVLLDFAIKTGIPVVPIFFSGGLPVEPLSVPRNFPLGHGTQDHWVGAPIEADELAALPYRDRVERVLAAMNSLGPGPSHDEPNPADREFEASVVRWQEKTGVGEPWAVMHEILTQLPDPSVETRRVLEGVRRGAFEGNENDPLDRWLARALHLMCASLRVVTI